jgi:hypothetical protein
MFKNLQKYELGYILVYSFSSLDILFAHCDPWSQSYDFKIYNHNASVVGSRLERFSV